MSIVTTLRPRSFVLFVLLCGTVATGTATNREETVAARTPSLERPNRDIMWDWIHPTNWFASEADLLRFCGLWGFFALLGAFEALFPAMMQRPERSERWPANLGLGLMGMAIAPLPPFVCHAWQPNGRRKQASASSTCSMLVGRRPR